MIYREFAFGLLVFAMLTGCRHGVNPNGPVAPMTLLTPQTKVPPPATGSYSIPGGYYQGQASNFPTKDNYASAEEKPIGSGVAQVAGQAPSQATPTRLPAWTDYSPRYANVQPAEYVAAGQSGYVSATDGKSNPAELRPQLRGMQVVDLTKSDMPSTSPPDQPADNRSAADLQPATRSDSSALPWRDPIQ